MRQPLSPFQRGFKALKRAKGLPAKSPANSMVEYILPVAAIGVIFIVAAATLGPSFKDYIGASAMNQSTDPNSKTIVLKSYGSGVPEPEEPALTAGDGQVVITLSNGKQITLDSYPTDLAKSVETVGGNATTEKILANIQRVAQQLLDLGVITPAEYSRFMSLSNAGHQLAAIQGQVEANPVPALYTTIGLSANPFPGNEYSLNRFSPEMLNEIYLTPNVYTSAQVVNFVQEYDAVRSSASLQDPKLKTLLKSLSNDINMLIFTTSSSANDAYTTKSGTLQQKQLSKLSQNRSSSICKAGDGFDTGTNCS